MQIPFSDAFLQEPNPANFSDYLSNLLVNIVNVVIPPLISKLSTDSSGGLGRLGGHPAIAPTITSSVPEIPKVFYQHQDPGTYPQLVLETAVIELLSLQFKPSQVVSTLVHIAVKVQASGKSLIEQGLAQQHSQNTSTGLQGSNPRSPLNASSPPGQGVDSYINSSGSTTATQNPGAASPLMIQACGLLLAQLPTPFHGALYVETGRILKECWWMTDAKQIKPEIDAAYAYSVWDPTWAIEDDTSTVIG